MIEPKIILVGGWEFIEDDGIDQRIAQLAGGKILFIPNASSSIDKQIERANTKYQQYQTEVILLESDANKIPDGIKVVYLGGGKPEKLLEYFSNHSELWNNIKECWQRKEIILAGSSTGAMIVFPQMLAHGSRGEGGSELTPALGLLKNNAIAIPHWDTGKPEWREKIVADLPDKLLITLDEHTALFCNDQETEVVGLGKVRLIKNGQEISEFKLES